MPKEIVAKHECLKALLYIEFEEWNAALYLNNATQMFVCVPLCAAIVLLGAPLLCSQGMHDLNPTLIHFQNRVLALSELSTSFTMAWMADRQIRTMLLATVAIS